MTLPPGYDVVWPSVEGANSESTPACKLKKSLYGLKQASSKGFFGIVVYVDDILVAATHPEITEDFKLFLSQHFKFKDLGAPKYFLGLEIARNKNGILVSQRKYTMDLLLRDTRMLGCKPSVVPMDLLKKLRLDSGTPLKDASKYRRLIGRLLYLCITSPDVTFAVHKLSQYVSNPSDEHWETTEKIIRYLKGSPEYGLFYSSSSKVSLSILFDADWAACPDTRKSMTGYCLFLGSSMISWKVKKQNTISRSSAEAEKCVIRIAIEMCLRFFDSSPAPSSKNAAVRRVRRPPYGEGSLEQLVRGGHFTLTACFVCALPCLCRCSSPLY
ncbi:hypothetical protein SASPL_108119 [Salvia splendens]|uniref:Reverse transcriptase Ty1/copia-type domain-containing protein n=1 Tax=Salvia splendens TaxID=180675 RepID=A0A8X8YCI3_SALSN|nr:hypothetical protein SASPL_108119 [Salvia splendens]